MAYLETNVCGIDTATVKRRDFKVPSTGSEIVLITLGFDTGVEQKLFFNDAAAFNRFADAINALAKQREDA